MHCQVSSAASRQAFLLAARNAPHNRRSPDSVTQNSIFSFLSPFFCTNCSTNSAYDLAQYLILSHSKFPLFSVRSDEHCSGISRYLHHIFHLLSLVYPTASHHSRRRIKTAGTEKRCTGEILSLPRLSKRIGYCLYQYPLCIGTTAYQTST